MVRHIMRHYLPIAGLLAALTASVGPTGCTPQPAEHPGREAGPASAWSIESARVLFTGRRGGLSELYEIDLATGAERRVTQVGTPEGGANQARVSPDGTRIAFQVRRGADYEIHLMDLETGSSANVTNHPEYDVSPVWSPAGDQLAFMSTRGFELGSLGPFPGHVYVLDLRTQELRQVTGSPLTSSLGPSDWSPDGATLLLARVAGESIALHALDVATGDERSLLATPPHPASEYSGAFSHDGTRIAFHAESGEESHIVVASIQGSDRRVLTRGPGLRYNPRWSPDDSWILFTSSEDGDQYDLQAVRVADGLVRDIVATNEDEREGDWWHRDP